MRIVTAAEMKHLEAEAGRRGIPEATLMAEAGAAVAQVVERYAPDQAPVVILVGTGNNGGDALVAAQHLLARGRPVALWTIPNRQAPGPVPAKALAAARTLSDLDALREALASASVVVDGLYWTGLSRAVTGIAGKAITLVNAAARRVGGPLVIAIDIPSGVSADTGAIAGPAIQAAVTVALGHPKTGLYIGAGTQHAGRIEIVGIGLPEDRRVTDGPQVITTAQVRQLLPRRAITADKRDAGSVIIVGGELRYPGAPRLAGLGAMRAGAGYVTLAVPRSIYAIVASTLLEATYLPLPELDGDLGTRAAEVLGEDLQRYTAMVLGCGLGRENDTASFIERLLGIARRRREVIGFGSPTAAAPTLEAVLPPEMPTVIDADALNLLSDTEDWHKHLSQPAVLTPNIREMARLTGKETEEIEADPWRITGEAATRWGQVVVLKKGHGVVATPEGQIWVAEQASPALATAGTGDVLSGVIGGLLAQGLAPWQAAVAALHVGMLAAERGVTRFGVGGLIAGDLPLLIAETLRDITDDTTATDTEQASA